MGEGRLFMIYEFEKGSKEKLFPLFGDMTDTKDTMILSCLQGYMGKAWTDNLENPAAAEVIVGAIAYFAGNADSEASKELLDNLPPAALAIVSTNEWEKRIETLYQGHIKKFQRYAFKRDPKNLDYNHLKSFLSTMPDGYTLKKVDSAIAHSSEFQALSDGFTGMFDSIDDFVNKGVGYCITYNDQIVCGATSFTVYKDGIEIEIVTHPDHRKKGLATIAAAALILDCLDRGKYPNWDAANLNSVNLAQKLGYVLEGPYDAYYIDKNRDL